MDKSIAKKKKAMMFASQKGKCDYCGKDMILSFENYASQPNLATFDHLYNRDHEERGQANGEKRIFLVCKTCNGNKSRSEINNQEPNTSAKVAKKFVPKESWSDEKFMQRIEQVIEEERLLNTEISKIDNQIKRLCNEKKQLCEKVSKKNEYRSKLINNLKELNQ